MPKRDLALELLLPAPLVGSPADAVDLFVERTAAEAVEALPEPTRRPPVADPLGRLDDLVRAADRERLAWTYRGAATHERPRLIETIVAGQTLEWCRAWYETGSHPDAAGTAYGLALWEASLAARGDAENWSADSTADALLAWAEETLAEIAARYPDDPTADVLAQRITTPERDTAATVRAKAARWQAIDPYHPDGLYWLVERLRAPAYGDEQAVLDVLGDVVAHAPLGAAAHGVVALGLCELYGDARATGRLPVEAAALFRHRAPLLRAAYAKGPGHEDWAQPYWSGLYRNCFAFGFCAADLDTEAWREFVLLEGYYTHFPWSLLGDPLSCYADARAELVRRLDEASRDAVIRAL